MLRTSITGEIRADFARGSPVFQCAWVLGLPTIALSLIPIWLSPCQASLRSILPWYSLPMQYRVLRLERAFAVGSMSLLMGAGCETFVATTIEADATTARDGGTVDVDGSSSGGDSGGTVVLDGAVPSGCGAVKSVAVSELVLDSDNGASKPTIEGPELKTWVNGGKTEHRFGRLVVPSRNIYVSFEFQAQSGGFSIPSNFKTTEFLGGGSNNVAIRNQGNFWVLSQYLAPDKIGTGSAPVGTGWMATSVRIGPSGLGHRFDALFGGVSTTFDATAMPGSSTEIQLGAYGTSGSNLTEVRFRNIAYATCM
jgi:hypothetical protein